MDVLIVQAQTVLIPVGEFCVEIECIVDRGIDHIHNSTPALLTTLWQLNSRMLLFAMLGR